MGYNVKSSFVMCPGKERRWERICGFLLASRCTLLGCEQVGWTPGAAMRMSHRSCNTFIRVEYIVTFVIVQEMFITGSRFILFTSFEQPAWDLKTNIYLAGYNLATWDFFSILVFRICVRLLCIYSLRLDDQLNFMRICFWWKIWLQSL